MIKKWFAANIRRLLFKQDSFTFSETVSCT